MTSRPSCLAWKGEEHRIKKNQTSTTLACIFWCQVTLSVTFGRQETLKKLKLYWWTFAFSQIVNLDDVVDIKEISGQDNASHFLTGPNRQSLKIFVVITPLSKYSQLWKIFLQFLVTFYHGLSIFSSIWCNVKKNLVFSELLWRPILNKSGIQLVNCVRLLSG